MAASGLPDLPEGAGSRAGCIPGAGICRPAPRICTPLPGANGGAPEWFHGCGANGIRSTLQEETTMKITKMRVLGAGLALSATALTGAGLPGVLSSAKILDTVVPHATERV